MNLRQLLTTTALASLGLFYMEQPACGDTETVIEGEKTTDTFSRLKNVIVQQLNVDEGTITPETNFINDLGADSLSLVELVMGIEEEFGITIPEQEAEKMTTVQDAVAFIDSAKS